MVTKTREMGVRLVPLHYTGKGSRWERGIGQTESTIANSPCSLPIQTRQSCHHHQPVQRTIAVDSPLKPPPLSTLNQCGSRQHPHSLKTPASHRARGGARTVSLSLGANREGKERIKGKANREPDRVCARVCTTERTTSLAKFPEPTPFVLTTVVMVAVSTSGSTDSRQVLLSCRLNPFLRKKLPASHRAWRGVMEGLWAEWVWHGRYGAVLGVGWGGLAWIHVTGEYINQYIIIVSL